MHPMSTECADSIGVLGDGYWECIVQLRDRLSNDPCPQKCNEVFALVHGSVCTAREVTYLPNAIGVFLAESGVQAVAAGDICYGDCLSYHLPLASSLAADCEAELTSSLPTTFESLNSSPCVQLVLAHHKSTCKLPSNLSNTLLGEAAYKIATSIPVAEVCVDSIAAAYASLPACQDDLLALAVGDACPSSCVDTLVLAQNHTCSADEILLLPYAVQNLFDVVTDRLLDFCYSDCLTTHLPLAINLAADCQAEFDAFDPSSVVLFESLGLGAGSCVQLVQAL